MSINCWPLLVVVLTLCNQQLPVGCMDDDSDFISSSAVHLGDGRQHRPREALNIQERNDLVRILTNNLRTGRELEERDLPAVYYAPANSLVSKSDVMKYIFGHYGHPETKRDGMNRRSLSVPELAQLLNNMKTRETSPDAVKLQSLRFGR